MAYIFYNGYRLPDINSVWTDKTAYPYALIGQSRTGKVYLDLLSNPFIYDLSKKKITISGNYKGFTNDYSGWTLHTSRAGVAIGTVISSYEYYERWTNVDILCDDGTLYLAASVPVAFIAHMNHIEAFMLGKHLRHSLMGSLATAREMSWADAANEKLTFEKIGQIKWSNLTVLDWPDK